LIWLLGRSNPNEIHHQLREEPGFERRFFDYFEDIIQHHLPDVEIPTDKHYEPRVERPPVPPQSVTGISAQTLHEWHMFMESEVKKLGEVLQRHSCKPVCHKYGNEDKCRFQFPHEIVPNSHFDSDSNSIVLKCLDGILTVTSLSIADIIMTSNAFCPAKWPRLPCTISLTTSPKWM
jgi:hypothetical protein